MICSLRTLTTLFICLGLSACGSTPKRPQSDNMLNPAKDSNLQQVLIKAETSQGDKSSRYQLVAAEIAFKDEQWALLRSILSKIDQAYLNEDELLRSTQIRSKLLEHEGDKIGALAVLESPYIYESSFRASTNQQSIYLEKLAQLLARAGKIERAIDVLLRRDTLVSGLMADINRNNLWNLLIILPSSSINALANSNNQIKAGWGQLASIYIANSDIVEQANQLNLWQQQWKKHPANQPLPDDLQLLQTAAQNLPKRVMVTIPLSGNLSFVGKTLRDGILYAHWQQKNQGQTTPSISFIDSAQLTNEQLLGLIRSNTPDILIGPFDKEKAQYLADNASQIPNSIILNLLSRKTTANNIISFGLNPEDEALQLAQRALAENGNRALVISPNTVLGDRLQTAFIDEWISAGGDINQIGRYEDTKDISNTIKQALNIDKSEMRKRRLALNTGLTLEFEPRRRQDIDIAAFFAKPQDARSIVPLFDFHYAQEIPLYTTSLAYNGEPNISADKDLEGVIYNDIPWLFDPASTSLQNIEYKRLFAMGIDAYKLQRRFKLLAADTGKIQGATGTLKLNHQREIVRTLNWATFKDGMPYEIPAISTGLISHEQTSR